MSIAVAAGLQLSHPAISSRRPGCGLPLWSSIVHPRMSQLVTSSGSGLLALFTKQLITPCFTPRACWTADEKLSSLLNHSGSCCRCPHSIAFERILVAVSECRSGTSFSTSIFIPSFMSISVLRRRESTCSSVRDVILSERRVMIRSDEPSTSVSSASRPVSGGKSTSFSCGYWLSQLRSAPRSTMPICISKIVIASPSLPAPPAVA